MSARFAGHTVSLDAVLAAREARVARRDAALASGARAVVTVTPVMPGPVKDCAIARDVQIAALNALDALFRAEGWASRVHSHLHAETGPEAIIAVAADPKAVKWGTVAIEEGHRFGRLFDLDVTGPDGGLSRRDLDLPQRRCFVCGEPAHACARSRAHPLATLHAAMEDMVDACPV
jgi:holo-ACP synthase